MRVGSAARLLLVILLVGNSSTATSQEAEVESLNPQFVVYANEQNAALGSSLFRVLTGTNRHIQIDKAATIEEAATSDAEVLVLVMPGRRASEVDQATLDRLKNRKIVGIGFGAAQLFGQIGLEINGGACAHGVRPPIQLIVQDSGLLGQRGVTDPIEIFQNSGQVPIGIHQGQIDVFAMFLPSNGHNEAVVDPIARWSSNPNYAPIVRQGNCVLIGIPAPANSWTNSFSRLLSQTCTALLERDLEEFTVAERELTEAGIFAFRLAPRGSTDQPFGRTFYFRFAEPQNFSARLNHSGSNSVMMLFLGEDQGRNHSTRKDAHQGEMLSIDVEITESDIKEVGDRYWRLKVTNFGADEAECRLSILMEQDR